MTMEVVTAGDLGGYTKGGDPATYLPGLWGWIVGRLAPDSIIDIGCAEGIAVDFFARAGVRHVLGVEGVPQHHPLIVHHDYTRGPYVPAREYDVAWCCEFVEHVEERFMENYLATFRAARILLMTYAEPGQPGYHHVNCQTQDYWIEKLREIGFALDTELSLDARIVANTNTYTWTGDGATHVNHFMRSGLVFRQAP